MENNQSTKEPEIQENGSHDPFSLHISSDPPVMNPEGPDSCGIKIHHTLDNSALDKDIGSSELKMRLSLFPMSLPKVNGAMLRRKKDGKS